MIRAPRIIVLLSTFFVATQAVCTPSYVAAWYYKNLAQEAESLQQEALTLFNISYDAWQVYKNNKEASYKSACDKRDKDLVSSAFYAPPSARIQSITRNILAQRGLSHRNIPLLCKYATVESTQFSLTLSDAYFKHICPADVQGNPDQVAVEAIILHELCHMQYADMFERYCMESFVIEHTEKNTAAWHQLKQQYNYFIERRADIVAGLVDIKYARASAQFFADCLKKYGEISPKESHGEHPLYAERHAYLAQLVEYMECEVHGGMIANILCGVKRVLGVW
jgi:hypothetical protein